MTETEVIFNKLLREHLTYNDGVTFEQVNNLMSEASNAWLGKQVVSLLNDMGDTPPTEIEFEYQPMFSIEAQND